MKTKIGLLATLQVLVLCVLLTLTGQAHAQDYTLSIVAWGGNGDPQSDIPAGLTGVTAIAAGYDHSAALKSDGTVVAWGTNIAGSTNVPAGLSGVIAIAAGGYHTVALKSDGTVVAWGNNGDGQCNVPVGLSDAVAVAGGTYHTVALKSDGTVVAWGTNIAGSTNVPADLTGVIAIAAGHVHTVALKSDGTVVAWGANYNGQCNVPDGLTGVTAVAAGLNHTLALKWDGTVVAWGDNSTGQCNVPTGLTDVIAVDGGLLHSVALKSDGTVVAWGDNTYGELNIPAGLARVTAISVGNVPTLALYASIVNHAPVADSQSVTTAEDTAANGTLQASDQDGNSLAYAKASDPAHGMVIVNANGAFTYTPNANFNGTDSFTYKVNDGRLDSNVATVTITVTPVNDAPNAAPDTEAATTGVPVTITVLDNDADIDHNPIQPTTTTHAVTLASLPANGTATVNADGTITYTSRNGYTGTDTFNYTLTDSGGLSSTTSVTVTVSKPNRPPHAQNDQADTAPGVPIEIFVLGNDSDPDGNPLTITSITQPGANEGTVTFTADRLIYTPPNAKFKGPVTFTYTISDGKGGTDTGRVSVHVR